MSDKIPLRRCVGCRQMKPKRELIRVARVQEGDISLDLKGKKPGRGAYLCPQLECINKARKSAGLERSFSQKVSSEIYDSLLEQLKGGDGGDR